MGHELTATSEERHKGLAYQVQPGKAPSISGDFWTTSTWDMDISAVHSQASMSSITTSVLEANGGIGSTNPTLEFVNHGLLLWNQTRQRWVGHKSGKQEQHQVQKPNLSWDAAYESLLWSSKPFPRLIPLAEMVDFLMDIWAQEGIYD